MLTKSTHGLKDVAEGLLRPLNQTELIDVPSMSLTAAFTPTSRS